MRRRCCSRERRRGRKTGCSAVLARSLRTLRQRQEVVRLQSIVEGLQVLVSLVPCDDDVDSGRADRIDIEAPSPILYPSDRLIFGQPPAAVVPIRTANMRDPEVWILPRCLVDAFD